MVFIVWADEIRGEHMKTAMLPEYPDAKSPAGADIRFIMDGATGNMIHSRPEIHLHRHAALAGRLRGYSRQGEMAANDLMLSAIRCR